MIKQRSNLILPVSLYAIGGSKDVLNLHTGELTHRIGKIVFDGTENWSHTTLSYGYCYVLLNDTSFPISNSFCSHFKNSGYTGSSRSEGRASLGNEEFICIRSYPDMNFRYDSVSNTNEFKAYLAAQYAAGTPVTVWYILGTPTTEIVTVPEGLSGIVEGYLIQDGTPTPQNPIYPTSCDSVDMWNEVMYRQYGVNETLSPIPTTVFSQGDGIDSCTVYGNTVQNGIPSPDVPVDIIGVGDMSKNLFDLSTATIGKYINSSGIEVDTTASGPSRLNHTDYIAIIPNTTYTYTCYGTAPATNTIALNWFDSTKQLISRKTMDTVGIPEYSLSDTSPANAVYCIINFTGYNENLDNRFMFNIGPSSLPFEPYGHVVSIEVDNAKITVPLNTTQSIRRIQKLVLTGDETFDRVTVSGDIAVFATTILNEAISAQSDQVLSTHYIGSYSTDVGSVYIGSSTSRLCFVDDYATPSAFKQYLQQQYQAGTPVTVYYVLTEPQTTTLNEPLMKIGDYADSVTYSSNIPTTYGQNDITTDTQIKPSKLDITYNALRRAKVYKNNRWILNPSIDWSQTLKISDLQSKKIKEMEGEYIGYNIHT